MNHVNKHVSYKKTTGNIKYIGTLFHDGVSKKNKIVIDV